MFVHNYIEYLVLVLIVMIVLFLIGCVLYDSQYNADLQVIEHDYKLVITYHSFECETPKRMLMHGTTIETCQEYLNNVVFHRIERAFVYKNGIRYAKMNKDGVLVKI